MISLSRVVSKQEKREIALLPDEKVINECKGLIYCHCNKIFNCHIHGEVTAEYVLIHYNDISEKRVYLCPICQAKIENERVEEESRKTGRAEYKKLDKLAEIGIGGRYSNINIGSPIINGIYSKNILLKIPNVLEKLLIENQDVLIQGQIKKDNSKCGKTLMIALFINVLLEEKPNLTIKYNTFVELVNILKSKDDKVINSIKRADVLFIDDINCVYSDYTQQQFKDLLDYRYRNQLSTIVSVESNEFIDMVLHKLDRAIILNLEK